ncbi:MAG: DUF4249 family protein [Gemmatimonadetes bacterium]|nr:DUF4249 family protein [Gemmatimonadota bacterium]
MKNKTGHARFIPTVLAFAILAGLAAHPGCSGERDPASLFGPAENVTVVVDAVLYVDRPLPEITVTRTRAANVAFVEEAAAVNDAEVTVIQGLAEYRYESAGQQERYLPPPDAPEVRPKTEYRLRVRALGGEVRGVTVTPDRMEIDEIAILEETSMEVQSRLEPEPDRRNEVVYGEGLIEVRFDPLEVEAYQVVVLEGGYAEGGSPPLKAPDGRLRLPWFAIGSSGEHEVEVYALDRNLFDFLRSVEASGQNAFGFGSLAGDTFERPVFNLDGGIGVFGSASVDTFGFVVLPEDRSG